MPRWCRPCSWCAASPPYFNAYFISQCGVRVLEQVRLDFFRKLQALPLGFFARHPTGDLISRGLADTQPAAVHADHVANEIFKQPATLVFAIGSLRLRGEQEP